MKIENMNTSCLSHSFADPSRSYRSRRAFLQRAGSGFGLLALAGLLEQQSARAGDRALHPMAPQPPHNPPRATSVIWLFMNGGQSHVDTWQYKPALEKWHDKELPHFDKNTGFFTDQVGPVMRSPFKFSRQGQSGAWVSEIFPYLSKH